MNNANGIYTGHHGAGDDKLRFDLIHPDMIRELARVFTVGAGKHGDWNWFTSPMEYNTVMGGLKRHLDKWEHGESWDEEKFHHLAAVAWRALVLMVYDLMMNDSEYADARLWTIDNRVETASDEVDCENE